jgi:hypothetical protein
MPRSSETLLKLTTLWRVMNELGRTSLEVADAARLAAVIEQFSRMGADLIGGGLYKTARTERFGVIQNQRLFWTEAWPIDTTTAPVAVHNISSPRVWTVATDVVSADYVICNAEMAERGVVMVDHPLTAASDALQITYTGGLASFTGAEGADGAVTAGTLAKFGSASAHFINDGVAVGMDLVITSGANAGAWRISAVDSNVLLTCDRVFGAAAANPSFAFTAGTGISYYILDSAGKSLVHDWPEIAEATAFAVADYWRSRGGRAAVSSESAGGASASYLRPYSLPYFARDVFLSLRKRWTP